MEAKLRILMQNENLTASRLAEILEIQPAAVSHILKGRNKPSFELVCKLVNRFPKINPYWLLGNSEQIYNEGAAANQAQPSGTLFDMLGAQNSTEVTSDKSNIAEKTQNLPISTSGRSDIEKIIVVYSDQTFEELRPKR